jgi:hypothetical protein
MKRVLTILTAGAVLVPALLLYRTPEMALALSRVVYCN